MSGAAPPAPPSSPAVLARASERCEAEYLRYSAPTAKLTGFFAQSCSGVSPLITPRSCDSVVSTLLLACWLTKLTMSGVIEPEGPKTLIGVQELAVLKQPVLLASRACWVRDRS